MLVAVSNLIDSGKVDIIPENNANWVNNTPQFQRLLEANPRIKTIVEIGAFIGAGSTKVFGSCVKERDGRLICVDPFDLDTDAGLRAWCSQCRFTFPFDNVLGQFISNMFHARLHQYVDIFHGTSDSFFKDKSIKDLSERVDLVYIDGNHHYEFAKKDVVNAIKSFPNAIICGDDWDDQCWKADIRRAVSEAADEYGLKVEPENNFWVLTKKSKK